MAATNGGQASAAAGELTVKPPPHITIPPKGVRDAVAKTADFVYRRADKEEAAMVARIRASGKQSMSFVLPDDQYNPYYAWYLQQLREGKGPSEKSQVADTKPKGPPEPAKFRFSARMPNISAKDLEVLKLTALYTARVGENWLKELRSRESGNSAFDFLRANHSFQSFFRALIDQYKILLEEEATVEARIEELQRNIKNRFHVLDRAKGRAEYDQYISQQKEKEEKKAEDDKKEWASIDWHDFSVIATVLFDEGDDAADLPPPTILSDLQSASLEQKAAVSLSARRIEEAMPDEVLYYNATQASTPSMPAPGYPGMAPTAPPVQPAYPQPPPTVPVDYRQQAQNQREEEEARIARERQAERDRAAQAQAAARAAPSSMRIRTDYVPRGKKANVSMVQCPNCMQNFPSDEIQEHMRIELLDPRWKEQRAKAEARYSTVINPTEAANNLKRFASQRDDIYDGVTGVPITEEEAARRKRAATQYDGQPDPAKDAVRLQQMQNMNVQEQLRRIQERHAKPTQ
ncbi:hypothetical protein CC80DRAFT_533833 [Byssothecium circinans]|uniref:SURP motif domain-containing protein n=1 Tax=Byssothecium circinans TaxID=147558 RepID=A0A6A5U1P3_9PLEO|nr:hypothetical protein CC80DRAFT_533833 [Byssothecium circinans]